MTEVKITITDVAKHAKLGLGTVSRALNGGQNVSSGAQERVNRAMAELGYVPNRNARNLKRQRSHTLGFLFASDKRRLSDPFFSTLMAGLADAAGQQRHDLLVASCPDPAEEMATLDGMVNGNRVGGMILTDTRINDPRVAMLRKSKTPFVAFGRLPHDCPAPWIDVDGAAGVRKAMLHLQARGHSRIGFIGLPTELTYALDRLSGFNEAHGAQDLICIAHGLTEADGRSAAETLLAQANPPTALVACSDVLALGALQVVQRSGRAVAVIGFDDIPIAAHTHPALSTVRQPIYEIGSQLVDLLIRHMNNEPAPSKLLEPDLVLRESA